VVGDRFLVTENENDPYASTINLLLNWAVRRGASSGRVSIRRPGGRVPSTPAN
jgi:hypothetical protein